nr:MAG TPA: hypothetical protein [Caudoviricetes sp.]
MTEIALKIANQVIQLPEPRPRLVAGSAGVYAVTLAYDAQWDDATVRVVVFDGGLCNSRVSVQDTTGTVTIPAECIAHGGRGNWLQIGVLGYDGTGALRITTRAMLDGLRIDPAGASDADVPQDAPAATPGLWEKLVADVGNLSDLQTSDTSSLVAAINELAAKPAGYKPYPVTLTQSGNKWTADHTYAEVREALSQGYSPYCIYKNFHVPCTGVDDKYKVIDYTGWLGNFTEAVFISQNASRVSVVARNTYGVDYLSFLVDKDTVGGFGYLNALLDKGTRVAVVYNLGGTPPEGQDLSAMTFPALLWGISYNYTDPTARTKTCYLLGAGGDRWRIVQNHDTKAVTFEQVGADGDSDLSLGLSSATVGQTIKVKAVDTDGKPTAWESVNLPGGGAKAWTKIIDADVTEVTASFRADGLANVTEFDILWSNLQNAATLDSGLNVLINNTAITSNNSAVIVGKSGSSKYGWTRLTYDGLFWHVQKSAGAIYAGSLAANSTIGATYTLVRGVGAATSFVLDAPTMNYAPVSGKLEVWAR